MVELDNIIFWELGVFLINFIKGEIGYFFFVRVIVSVGLKIEVGWIEICVFRVGVEYVITFYSSFYRFR